MTTGTQGLYTFVRTFNGQRTGRNFSTANRAEFDRELRASSRNASDGNNVLVVAAPKGFETRDAGSLMEARWYVPADPGDMGHEAYYTAEE